MVDSRATVVDDFYSLASQYQGGSGHIMRGFLNFAAIFKEIAHAYCTFHIV